MMKRRYFVGNGLFKLSFGSALQQATAGDVLIVDPGVYSVGAVGINGISIQGNGDAVEDVVLQGCLVVDGDVTITNIAIENGGSRNGKGENCCLLIHQGSQFNMINCLINSGSGDEVGAVSKGNTSLKNCNFSCRDGSTALKVSAGNCQLENCKLKLVWVTDAGQVTFTDTLVTDAGLSIEDNGKVTGKRLFLDANPDYNAIEVDNGGQLTLNEVVLLSGVTTMKADHGLIQVAQSNADLTHRALYTLDTQSTVSFPGAEERHTN